jgi:hypothetical protein
VQWAQIQGRTLHVDIIGVRGLFPEGFGGRICFHRTPFAALDRARAAEILRNPQQRDAGHLHIPKPLKTRRSLV